MDTERISFKELQEKDLPLIHQWLNTPHVNEWWSLDGNHRPSFDDVAKHFLPRTRNHEPVYCYLVNINDKPIGMIQYCRLDDYPVEKAAFGLEESCAGVDLFIGEEDYIHKGLGSTIIKRFLKEILFVFEDVCCCIIDPEPKNEIAIKAYSKAGFKYLKTVWNVKDKVAAYIMSINRNELESETGESGK